jgi:hypothetical protein
LHERLETPRLREMMKRLIYISHWVACVSS